MFGIWKKKQPTVVVTSCVFNCMKEKCPKWVVLMQEKRIEGKVPQLVPVGKCADAWLPGLLVELQEGIYNASIRTTNSNSNKGIEVSNKPGTSSSS